MKAHYGETIDAAWRQYTGGYWAKLMTPEETWIIRPDGSIAEMRKCQRRIPIVYGKVEPNDNS